MVFGDSLVSGYGLAQSQSFPARLEAALRARGHEVAVQNAGVAGETSAGARARIAWALGERVDAAILVVGGNDVLRALDPAATAANLDAVLARLGAEGIPVLLAGLRAPANLGPAYQEAFDSLYPRLAGRHGALLYPFFLDGVALEPSLNQGDGIHPNARGVETIVARMLPMVEALIARARTP
ncbi:MAG: arylesterase [Proteobacteria bacterium]|nr:arylesterase [Pseudomonadota bacterium]